MRQVWGGEKVRKLIICDKNPEVTKAARELLKTYGKGIFDDVQVIDGDVIKVHESTPGSKIVTASNPRFSPDGGLDAILANKYEWEPKEFSWSNDLFYIVSVDDQRRSSKDILLRAAVGILGYSSKFIPILTGIGTGVGGVAIEVFTDVLRAVLTNLRSANLSYANLSYANLSYADLSFADLSYADLRSASLISANLSYANLSYANLSYADLSFANLSYADLRSASLISANLSFANLSYANLSYANLSYADLRSANLSFANLSYADLRSADLISANLSYADLRSANLRSANLRSADLRSADLISATNPPYQWHSQLSILRFQTGKLKAFKYINTDGSSPVNSGKKIVYKVGKFYREPDFNRYDSQDCGAGINVATLEWCERERDGKPVIEVEFDAKDIVSIPYASDGKFRIKRCKVLRRLTEKEIQKLIKKTRSYEVKFKQEELK